MLSNSRQSEIAAEVAGYPVALLIDILWRALNDAIDAALTDAGFGDLNRSHGVVFDTIDPAGARVVDMAKRARITKQGMGQLVAAVESMGYVQRVTDPADARARLVSLTRKGEAAAAAGRAGLAEFEDQMRGLLGDAEFGEIHGALVVLVAALGAEHVR